MEAKAISIYDVVTYAVDLENARARIGAFMDQCGGRSMEDTLTIIPDFDGGKSTLVAVYDGHGGSAAAKFCAKHLHRYLLKNTNFMEGKYKEAFEEVFLQMDRLMRSKAGVEEMERLSRYPIVDLDPDLVEMVEEHGAGGEIYQSYPGHSGPGTTALVVLLQDDKIIVANAGDCHCTLVMPHFVWPLSYDHNVDNYGERCRVTAAGGYIERGYAKLYAMLKMPKTGKPDGLTVTRGLGDIQFKMNPELKQENQAISAVPDVQVVNIKPEYSSLMEFLVIASDGIVRERLEKRSDLVQQKVPLSKICLDIANDCGTDNGDNITAVVVQFKREDETEDETVQPNEWEALISFLDELHRR